MDPKTTLEKLQILLPHWVEHNQNHAAEFLKWSAAARADGAEKLASLLDQAAANMKATDSILKQAVTEAGAPAGEPHHCHCHAHGHDHGHEHSHGGHGHTHHSH